MLREICPIHQRDDEPGRRWFQCIDMDLFVWTRESGEIVGFQLSYKEGNDDKALTWKQGKGFLHENIDSGDITGGYKMTPILLPDGVFHKQRIMTMFEARAEQIDNDVTGFVLRKIQNYPG